MSHRVLFVDDEPHVTSALKRALREEPYEILTADSGTDALAQLERAPVDIIVADEKMPGMSGTELLTIVRRHFPDTIRMVLTGHATLDTTISAINEGEIYRFFTKPCNSTEMATTIRQALRVKDAVGQPSPSGRPRAVSQALEMERLERRHPGITRVERDPNGAILLGKGYHALSPDELRRMIEQDIKEAVQAAPKAEQP